ncbi:calcium/calmodulin-dependent protein kinase I-like [Pimephales promelas]|uniref:calcium/calmodulin-dependent protein kinase I-like n=1 Tax=Pimephales promelas TaxID=90988 RepID=UPI00195593DB|nr:calcium/calmodulin-dependent protein kinase I-like [Pimephales promelas]
MDDMLTQQTNAYQKFSDADDDSDSPDNAFLLKEVLKEHQYSEPKELGRGQFGTVFLVKDIYGDPYVIKQLNSRDRKDLEIVKKEVKILKTMNCGYIVSYVKSIEDKARGLYYIVMEYCKGGDLFKKMQTQENDFEEQQILDWFVQICLALQYLHNERRNVLHRDIKPQNIFLTEDGYVILGDFGCSTLHGRADQYTSSHKGADLYRSPEADENKYISKSDIWSLGWLLYDLCMLDVWTHIKKRRFQQASLAVGHPLLISERYPQELRELIKEMLSSDPKDRPSADEILAKPFLADAVKRNKRIPEALDQRFTNSINAFEEAYKEHYGNFETLVEEWGKTTTALEETHRRCTIGSLSGAVFGTAGGITAVVGAILAPFTLGASLIVTAVGVGVGVAGGVAGAASSIANTVQQKPLRKNLENIQREFSNVSTPILESMNALRRVVKVIQKFRDFVSDSTDNVNFSCNVYRRGGLRATELVNVSLLANVGRIAAQTARVGRVAVEAVAAVTGVLSALLVIVDFTFIVVDAADIHQMNQGTVNDPKKVLSSLLKSIAQMRKTHGDLVIVLQEIKETRNELEQFKRIGKADSDSN